MKTEIAQTHQFLADQATPVVESLETWFRLAARPLPWRQQPSLYRTVVSEFMLQQTQVATVLPYFDRWIRALPDFEALAQAEEALVLKLWEGLGYYRRARNLHQLARSWVQANPKPDSSAAWIMYPGIGPYTAAAIASIVHRESVPVVDGNVVRILARLTDDATLFKDNNQAVRHFTPVARRLIEVSGDPGAHNEAMMELGATLCRSRTPECLLCPVRSHCRGYRSGRIASLPRLQPKQVIARSLTRLWVTKPGHLLLYQRPQNAKRLAGIWELPELESLQGPSLPKTTVLTTKVRQIAQERIEERILQAPNNPTITPWIKQTPGLTWVPLENLNQISLSGPHRRWITELLEPSIGG